VGVALHQKVTLLVDGTEAGTLDLQHPVGHLGHLGRVAIIGVEDTNQILLWGLPLLPVEKALDFGPGEEIGVDDLIRITAENEGSRLPQ